jgi:hypothetical protein
MRNRLLISVAGLALVAGTSFANAQGTGINREQGGAGIEHKSPSAGGSAGEQGGMHQRQSPTVGQAPSSEEKAPGQKKGMSSQSETKANKEMNAQGREGHTNAPGTENRTRSDGQSSQTTGQSHNQRAPTTGQNEMQKSPTTGEPGAAQQSEKTQRSQTTGQAGAAAKLSTEQRTQITSVIKEEHVAPVNNVKFSIAVGTRVPREGVTLHPLPSRVVEIYPEWRGYQYILVRDELVVVDPRTSEIVAVLPA